MPSNAFNRDVLKIAVAQICHSLGWNSLQKSSLVVLTDILERYMKKLSKATGWFCQNSTRTDVNLNDLGIAFDQLGIQLCELEDYVHQVEPINFQNSVPQFHSDTITAIQFPTNDEILVREEWYDEYMPPLGNKVEKDEPEKATMEEPENVQENVLSEQLVERNGDPYQSPVTLPRKRPAESPLMSPIEPKKATYENQLFLPNLIRPEVPRLAPVDSPLLSVSPTSMPVLPSSKECSTPKSTGKGSPSILQERSTQSPPKAAKQPKILSPSYHTENMHHKSRETKVKETQKRHEILQASNDHSRVNYLNRKFSPTNSDPLTSPINKPPATLGTPLYEKVQPAHKSVSSPLLESPTKHASQKPDVLPSIQDKKIKKAKKVKKTKIASTTKGLKKKSKQNTGSPFLNSSQLFALPHILKSPPEQKTVIAAVKASPASEPKQDQVMSPLRSSITDRSPATPEVKIKSLHSSVHAEKEKKIKEKEKDKTANSKGSGKRSGIKSKKKSISTTSSDKRGKSLQESPRQPTQDQFKSPDGITSPEMDSPKFSVAVSQKNTLSTPDCRLPKTKHGRAEEVDKKSSKKEEKKRKKDKKSKKCNIEEQKSTPSQKTKKQDTPSLKLTFKRAASGAYHEQHLKDSSAATKIRGLSPEFSSTVEKVRYPIEEVPAKPSEPKSRKPKKVKTTAVDKAHHKEKKTEPAVRIEPLVINESFSEMEYEEPFDWTKKAETKKTKVPKKEICGKKGRSSKNVETSKKTSRKKSESPKKPVDAGKKAAKTTASEDYHPDQFYTSPAAPAAPTGEQSVSRGLFIQTITEPTTTQVWYCPACLRPDDGSPMIGCDSCDGWYHWTCVGITQAPSEDVEWYCGTCVDRLSKKRTKKKSKKD